MAGQSGFFDTDERLRWLSQAGDPLERLAGVADFKLFRVELEAALNRSGRSKGGRRWNITYYLDLLSRYLVECDLQSPGTYPRCPVMSWLQSN